MKSDFSIELIDILVYLLPGSMLLTGLYLIVNVYCSDIFKSFKPITALGVFAFLFLSLFTGILIHSVSSQLSERVSEKLFMKCIHNEIQNEIKKGNYDYYGEVEDNIIKKISEDAKKILGKDDVKKFKFVFKYARTVVLDKSNTGHYKFYRTIPLKIFCLNSILPLFFLLIGIFLYLSKLNYDCFQCNLAFWGSFFIALFLLEWLLFYSTYYFLKLAMKDVLFDYLVLIHSGVID